MLTPLRLLAVALLAQTALLVALGSAVGLSAVGWSVGLTCGLVTYAAVAYGLVRDGHRLGPADAVTLTRATLTCAVAALVADALVREAAVPALLTLAVVALALDAVDGWLARRTHAASPFGARFDGEIDALLILVLSVYVAPAVGWWVLAIGAARYLFAVAGWLLPWLRRPLPPRYWRKVVAATQGVVLVCAATEILPAALTYAALAAALVLLVESFGRDVLWLWRHRVPPAASAEPSRGGVVATATNALAVLVVWVALVAPNQAHRLTPDGLLRVPLELLVVAGLALVLPVVAMRIVVVAAGVLLALLTVVKALDMGFFATFDRPFNPVTDRGYLDSAVDLVRDSVGPVAAAAAVVGSVLAVLALLALMPLSLNRLTGLVVRHRRHSLHVVGGLAVVWSLCAVSGLHVGSGAPVASMSSSRLAAGQVRAIAASMQDQERFDASARVDRFDDRDAGLLSGLRGKDVLLVFVESYGRIALEGSPSAPQVRTMLDADTRRLRASGYFSRSAYLTSPIFGGLSWLAHATLQSGLWVDNEPRYERLLAGDRMTLSRAFGDEGWRTVAVTPSNDERWPEGERFYDLDNVYYKWDFGYHGPRFGFSRMPDQYALRFFQARELAPDRRPPVMAEVDLASSHAPWAPVPRLLGWESLGDGSVYEDERRRASSRSEVWSDPARIEAAYAQSIRYSLRTLTSFIERYGDEDLVVVLLGDHQPATVVTGNGASHDVPVTIVAQDPAVFDQISGWGWQDGMTPDSHAPVWPMDTFRDRFLAAFSPAPMPDTAPGASDTDHVEEP